MCVCVFNMCNACVCRFGSTALQEHINAENVARLHSYYDEVASLHNDPGLPLCVCVCVCVCGVCVRLSVYHMNVF